MGQTAKAVELKKEEKETQGLNVEELKAFLKEQIKAELEAENQISPASSSLRSRPARDEWLEELVEIQLFKDGKDYKDDVFVSINGENCMIKRGFPVKVKRKFALILDNSQTQDIRANEYSERLQNASKEETIIPRG